jgi:hypothetical protein
LTYLVDGDEEKSISKNGPDKDVPKDASNKVVRVGNHQSTIPVNCDKSPSQRPGHHRRMDESGIRVVAEVERGEVDEVENENDLSPVEVRADKQHDKGEVEEVVEDEVASNTGSSVNNVRVARE